MCSTLTFAGTVLAAVTICAPLISAQDGAPLQTEGQKLSYASGITAGRGIKGQLPSANPTWVTRGFNDVLSGTGLLTEVELNNAMTELQTHLTAQQANMPNVYASVNAVTDALARHAITEAQASVALAEIENRVAPQDQIRHNALEFTTTAIQQNRTARFSYVCGAAFARSLQRESPDVSMDFVIRGIRDGLSGRALLLTPQELRASAAQLKKRAATTAAAAQGKQGEAVLAENKIRQDIHTLESGLQYKILKAGGGRTPTVDDTVVCHYRGTLLDGTEFGNSYQQNVPGVFEVQRVMAGWREALQLMPAGSKWQLFVPGHLANLSGIGVQPNTTVIFELELLSINGKP